MTKKVTHIGLLILTLLTACGAPPTGTPLPTPQAVILAYTPELRSYANMLASCARQYPDIAIYLNESVEAFVPDGKTNLVLALGTIPASLRDWYATLLSTENLVVIVNQQNPLTRLSAMQMRAIWNGEITNWDAVGGAAQPIEVWTYPPGSALRALFDSNILPGMLTMSYAWLAPDPQAMLESISADPYAIGYLPASWLDTIEPELARQLHSVVLPDDLIENFRQPVLALTEAEPQGGLRTLLLCYQAGE